MRRFAAAAAAVGAAAPGAALQVGGLEVEHLRAPLGVDVAAPRFSWVGEGSGRGAAQSAYRVNVTDADGAVVWDTQKVASAQSVLVPYAGPALASDARYTWGVEVWDQDGGSAAAASTFGTGLFNASDWHGSWITAAHGNQLRTTFTATSVADLSWASVFVSGIGYYELHCNGRKVGDHVLDVGRTDYPKRQHYASYDLKPYLVEGENVLGAVLGHGWHGGTPQMILQANLHQGGSVQEVVSDGKWTSHAGPILSDSLYNGETYDARLETPGWDAAGFDAAAWVPAATGSSSGVLSSQLFPPIREVTELPPVVINEPLPGMFVVDFGQNMPGWVRIRVRGQRGQNITLRHAEVAMHPPYGDADGTLYYANLRGAAATDRYTLRGDPDGEVYSPRFTQHGFRYCEITGLSYAPALGDIRAVVVHSDVAQTGDVAFSSPLLGKVQHAIVWGTLSNLMSVPTDCDNRNERQGWMGDAALAAEEANYNLDMSAFYTNFMRMVEDDQSKDGGVPNVVPGGGDGAANWQTAYPTILWSLLEYQGDLRVIKDHYPSLLKYFGYFAMQYNKTGIAGFFGGFGDWCPAGPKGDAHLVSAYSYIADLAKMVDMAGAIGEHADAATYGALHDKMLAEYHAAFFDNKTGYYKSGLQSEQSLPLWLGAGDKASQQSALDHLRQDIVTAHTGHTTCGIVGIKCELEALSTYGLGDIALNMTLQDTYPSYGYMVQGAANMEPATTLWELWNSDTQGPGMNSRNHIMFGSVGAWFYKYLLGLRPATPGFATFVVSPDPAAVASKELRHIEGSVDTPYGRATAAWVTDPPHPSSGNCGLADENTVLQLGCSGGGTITGVTFASYGTPTGSCSGGFSANTKCAANTSADIVSKACVGKQSCSVKADSDTFGGDPCYGTKKKLAVSVTCSGGHDVKPAIFTLRAVAPFGTQATVTLPVPASWNRTAATATITEGDAEVWAEGKAVPGVAGVSSATASADGTSVSFTIVSGEYNFALH